MLRLALTAVLILLLGACGHKPIDESDNQVFSPTPADPYANLEQRLGMQRASSDLGYADKNFNPCQFGATSGCKSQYFTVVQFQLLCRDSEGTVQNVPININPITRDNVRWQLGGMSGGTSTDSEGYGKFSVVSDQPVRNQRLILRIGKQFVAFRVSEVSKVVLPKNFCS